MTRQTVSICNVKGGVALSEEYAVQLAALLEWAIEMDGDPDAYGAMAARAQLRRVIRVLRGEAPAELGEFA
jgi:hypothetical protein